MLTFKTPMNLIEVIKTNNESSASLLRRFSRRFRGSGYLLRARNLRYASRAKSELKVRKEALHREKKREEMDRLKKLGKIRD